MIVSMEKIAFGHHDNHLLLDSNNRSPEKNKNMRKLIKWLKTDEAGTSAIEYALIATLIFLVIVSAIGVLSTNTTNMYNKISNAVDQNL